MRSASYIIGRFGDKCVPRRGYWWCGNIGYKVLRVCLANCRKHCVEKY
jgi:hypothetical protein